MQWSTVFDSSSCVCVRVCVDREKKTAKEEERERRVAPPSLPPQAS